MRRQELPEKPTVPRAHCNVEISRCRRGADSSGMELVAGNPVSPQMQPTKRRIPETLHFPPGPLDFLGCWHHLQLSVEPVR